MLENQRTNIAYSLKAILAKRIPDANDSLLPDYLYNNVFWPLTCLDGPGLCKPYKYLATQ